ncbi:hypothetical protein pb186bvf_003920 [Paramecium bursaria]
MNSQNLLLFKQDMLQWASQILEVPIQSIDEFRNGVYFILILRNLNHKYSKNTYFETPNDDKKKVYHNLTLLDLILKEVSKYQHNPLQYNDCKEESLYFDLDVIRLLTNQYLLNDFENVRIKMKKCNKLLKKNCHPMSKLSSLYQLFNVNKIQYLSQDMDHFRNSQDLFAQFEESKEFKPQNLSNPNQEKKQKVEIPISVNHPQVINDNLFLQQNNKNETNQVQQFHSQNSNDNYSQSLSNFFNRQLNSMKPNVRQFVQPQKYDQVQLSSSMLKQNQQENFQQANDQFSQLQKLAQLPAQNTQQSNENDIVKNQNIQWNLFENFPSQDQQKNQDQKQTNDSPIQQNQDKKSGQRVDNHGKNTKIV